MITGIRRKATWPRRLGAPRSGRDLSCMFMALVLAIGALWSDRPAVAQIKAPRWTLAADDSGAPEPAAAPAADPPNATPGEEADVPTELRDPSQGKSNLWYAQTSLYTRHFHHDSAHQNHQHLIDVEYWRDDGWLGGFAYFRNSFSQPTEYLFVGKRWRPFESVPRAYFRMTGGLLHGYKGEYRNKLPLNSSGTAPIILVGLGYSGRRFASEAIFFGTNGVMLTVGAFFY
ncbi:MAG: hypothetical protein QM766_05280 [Burkholderiaceae bacterium]